MPNFNKPTNGNGTAVPSGTTATGTPAPAGAGRPAGALNSKSVIRYEQIARYRVAGRMSDAKIAEMVGMTPQALTLAIKSPTYKEIEDGLLEGRLTDIDEQLAGEEEQIRSIARAAVPAALRALVEGVTQRRDLRSALVAAKTILQFDPNKTLTEQGKAPVDRGSGDSGPQLPENVIAYLSMQGNKVVAEIRTSSQPSVSISGEGLNPATTPPPSELSPAPPPSHQQYPSIPLEKPEPAKQVIPLILQQEGEA